MGANSGSRVGAGRVGVRRVGARRVGSPKFRSFFPATISLFLCLCGGSSRGILVVFLKAGALKCARLEFSGCRVKPRRPRTFQRILRREREKKERNFGRSGGARSMGGHEFVFIVLYVVAIGSFTVDDNLFQPTEGVKTTPQKKRFRSVNLCKEFAHRSVNLQGIRAQVKN